MSLFDDALSPLRAGAPLAVRMRPASLDEVVGQSSALAEGTPLRRMLDPAGASSSISVIVWGPPGTGKTRLARAVAKTSRHKRKVINLDPYNMLIKQFGDRQSLII